MADLSRCSNAEPGSFNHECGRSATWIGTKEDGFQAGFCDRPDSTGAQHVWCDAFKIRAISGAACALQVAAE